MNPYCKLRATVLVILLLPSFAHAQLSILDVNSTAIKSGNNSSVSCTIPVPADLNVVDPEPDSPPSSVDCDDFSNRMDRDELFGKAVDDSLEFNDNFYENSYLVKMKTFEALKNDSTIIYQSSSRDSAYVNFYNLVKASNIALFDSVLNLASDTSLISNAISLNASINDTNDLEFYRKTINVVYLSTIAQNLPMDASDSTVCEEISDLSYHVAGDAVFTAASMIGKEIHHSYVSSRLMNIESQIIKKNELFVQTFKIVPNPTNSFFQILGKTEDLKLVQILSSDFKIIREFNTSLSLNLPVEELIPGFYNIKLIEKDGTSHFLKLIIIR